MVKLIKSLLALSCVLALLSGGALASPPAPPQAKPVKVVIETEVGNITIEVDTVHAPITSANFLKC